MARQKTVTGLSVGSNNQNGIDSWVQGHTRDAAAERWYRSRSFSTGSIGPMTLLVGKSTVTGMTASQWASITSVLKHFYDKCVFTGSSFANRSTLLPRNSTVNALMFIVARFSFRKFRPRTTE